MEDDKELAKIKKDNERILTENYELDKRVSKLEDECD